MTHPLLDRRDITAQRGAVQAPPPSEVTSLAALVSEVATTNHLLQRLLTNERADVVHLCVTDHEPAQLLMDNFPVPGARRLIVRRSGAGGTIALTAATPTVILTPNDNRLGGQIVNMGAAVVTLFLSGDLLTPGGGVPLPSGAAQIGLNAGGGSWDLRLSNLGWAGTVIAVAGGGGSSVTVAEV